jgi:hypothetical protein
VIGTPPLERIGDTAKWRYVANRTAALFYPLLLLTSFTTTFLLEVALLCDRIDTYTASLGSAQFVFSRPEAQAEHDLVLGASQSFSGACFLFASVARFHTAGPCPCPASDWATEDFRGHLSPRGDVVLCVVRVRVEIMGPGKHENVGKSQSVLVTTNPIIFTRTRNQVSALAGRWGVPLALIGLAAAVETGLIAQYLATTQTFLPPIESVPLVVATIIMWAGAARVEVQGRRLQSVAVGVSESRIQLKGMLGRTSWCNYFMSLPIHVRLPGGWVITPGIVVQAVGVVILWWTYLGINPRLA